MKEMVNAFSDYARAPDMDMSLFDLDKLVHEVVDLYRAQESGVEDRPDVGSDHAADRGRHGPGAADTAQPDSQCGRGARKHRRTAGSMCTSAPRKSTAWISCRSRSRTTGRASSRARVSQIFDPYVTTKPKGTGLGLAIVKKLVEEHVGSIRARNRKDGGAMISIRLPVNEAARERDYCEGARTRREKEGTSMSNPHVLVVDDEADIRASDPGHPDGRKLRRDRCRERSRGAQRTSEAQSST